MSGGLCRDGVVAVSLGSRGGCRGESTGRPPDGGAPLPASQLPPFSRRAVTTRSRCLAQSRCAGPAPDRALPCGEHGVAFGLGGEGSGCGQAHLGLARGRPGGLGRARVQSGSPDGCGRVAWPRSASL